MFLNDAVFKFENQIKSFGRLKSLDSAGVMKIDLVKKINYVFSSGERQKMIQDQRGLSRKAILDAIRSAGRIARIDVAQATGISQATVTTVTAEMLRDGLIEEIAAPASDRGTKRGRPRVDLAIRGQAHLVAGVKVAHDTLSIALMDFAGELIGEYETPLSASVLSSADMAGELRTALEAALDKYAMPYSRLSGVGIGLAGFIDASRGFVHWSPSLTERNIPLQDIISEKIEVPVFIDNDANLVAVAEQYFGRGTEHTDFIVVTIESGVGMGIVLNGQLYRGDRGCGAEFGHTKVQLDGAMCRCGQRGCLEAYVADYAIEREAAISAPHIEENDRRVATVLQAAKDGDEAALKIVNRAGRMFAMGLANLVNVFDPQLIILAGERMQFDHLFEESVFEDVRRQVVHVDLPPPEIVTHKWGDLMWAKGAAAYAIDQVAERSLREIGENAG